MEVRAACRWLWGLGAVTVLCPPCQALRRHQGPPNPAGIFLMGFRPRRGSCGPQSHVGAGQRGLQWDGPSSCRMMLGPRS